jgi:5-methylcytosine-specific restriction protein A
VEERRRFDARRGSAASRGYDHNWRKVRAFHLQAEPLCRFHAERGDVVAAIEVDHIDGNSRNNDDRNLRSLCKSCHSARTARDQGFAHGR